MSDLGYKSKRTPTIALVLIVGGLIAAPTVAAEPTATSPRSIAPLISSVGSYEPVHLPTTTAEPPLSTPANLPLPASTATPGPVSTGIVHQIDSQVAPANCNGGGCQSCNGGATASGRSCSGDDFMWGCGPWPYANGPGLCDDWLVGPMWDVKVDGMTMFRPKTDLGAIAAHAPPANTVEPVQTPEVENEFDYGAGARLDITGKLPRCAGYWVEAAYEGIEEWNASVVFPKLTPIPVAMGAPASPVDSSQQRSIQYRSSLQSVELNFERPCQACQPFWGIRYFRFDDKLTDFINQEAPSPLPATAAITVTTTDRLNLFDLENNLIGPQIGLHRNCCQICQRLSIDAFANTGVYYNRIHRTNLMSVTTTQKIGDKTATPPVAGRTDVSVSSNDDVSEQSDIAYVAEASLTAVCQLNRCVALRGGYQILWIDNLHLADDAFLGINDDGQSLLFQGWHVGIECHR